MPFTPNPYTELGTLAVTLDGTRKGTPLHGPLDLPFCGPLGSQAVAAGSCCCICRPFGGVFRGLALEVSFYGILGRFMGSYISRVINAPNMGYNYSYPTYNATYNHP